MDSSFRFEHIGLVTDKKKKGEIWVEKTKVWVTDFAKHPFKIEWLRFRNDSPVRNAVRKKPHIAFRVPDIKKASKGMKVLLKPFDSGMDFVGFYESKEGAVIEFMEKKK